MPITLEPSGATTRSNDKGVFRLPLPAFVRPDDEVSLGIDKEGWRIRYPLDGELRVPAEPGRHVVEVELLPAGSKLFWSNDRVEKFIEDAIRQASAKTPAHKAEAPKDNVQDFSRAIRDWAERYGLSADAAKAEIDRWIGEVQAATEKDERKLGLAAFAEQQFEKAAHYFGLAAEAGVGHLAEIEAAENALGEKKEKARKAVVQNFRDQGLAEYNASRFEAAIVAYESALRHVSLEQDRQPWAELWNYIGLAHQGESLRGAGPELHRHVVSGVTAHRKVLDVIKREELPRDWAMAQSYLGSALLLQSKIHGENNASLRVEASSAYRLALEVLSRESEPLEWAWIQHSLGHAFLEQEFSGRPEGANGLADALAAFDNALDVFTRERYPHQWAVLQSHVGIALLGQSSGVADEAAANALLSRSVSAHRGALEVVCREHDPWRWMMIQASLGHVLSELASRSDPETAGSLLDEVILVHRSALEVLVREQSPQPWAHLQKHLGEALVEAGKRKPADEANSLLEEAKERFLLAREVFTREQLPVRWAGVEFHLAIALYEQGIRTAGEAGSSLLAQASEAFRLSLEVIARDDRPQVWATNQASLGEALHEQGRRAAGVERSRLIVEAVAAYRQALEVFTREAFPKEWEKTQPKLESALQEKAKDNTSTGPFLQTAMRRVP